MMGKGGHGIKGLDSRRTASIYNLLSQCERFGLTAEAARKEIENVVATVRAWQEHFHACGVSEKDVEYMA